MPGSMWSFMENRPQSGADGTPDAGRRSLDRTPLWLLGGVSLLFLVLAGLYAWVTPPLEGFDAAEHYMATLYWREYRRPPPLDNETAQYSYELIAQPPLYHVLAAMAGAGWPLDEAKAFVEASRNPYHAKVLSKRQTVTLPHTPGRVLAPIWLARASRCWEGFLPCGRPGCWRAVSLRSNLAWPLLWRRWLV